MYVDFNGTDFQKLKQAIKDGSEPEYQKYFGRCLGKYLDANIDGARVLRAGILQHIADSAGKTAEERSVAIHPHFRRIFLPYLLYREVIDGHDANGLLDECVAAISARYIPSDYDSIFLMGAAAYFYGRSDLLKRLSDLESIRRGTGYYDVETYANFYKALRQLTDGKVDSLTLDRIIDGSKFPSKNRSYRQFEKFHLTHLRIPAFEVILLALFCVPSHHDEAAGVPRYSAGVLVERLRAIETESADTDYRLICQLHELFAYIEDFKPFVDTSNAFERPFGDSPFAFLNSALYCAECRDGDFSLVDTNAAMASARMTIESGMYVLAMSMAGVLHSVGALSAEAGAILDVANKMGFNVLFKFDIIEEEWETMVRDLSCLPVSSAELSKKNEVKAKRVFDWEIIVEDEPDEDSDFVYVDEIKARIRTYSKTGTLTKGKTVSLKELLSTLPELEFGTEDFTSLLVAQKMVSNSRASYLRNDCAELLESLCSHPRVIVTYSLQGCSTAGYCLISEYESGIESKYNNNGDLELSVSPDICKTMPGRNLTNEPVLKKFGEFHFGIPVCSQSTLAAAKIILSHSDSYASITIPKESVENVMPVLKNAASTAIFRGEVSSPESAFDYQRVDVSPKIHVRISMATESQSVVTVYVLADVGRTPLALTPGKGEKKIMFRSGGNKMVFVRDLEKESANAAPVLDLINELGMLSDDNGFWTFFGLEPLLNLLEELKPLENTVDIDWSEKNLRPDISKVKSVRIAAKGKGADHWFGLSGEVSLDNGNVMAFEEIITALSKGGGKYIRLNDGKYLQITEQLRGQLELLHSMGEFKDGELQVNDAMLPALENSLQNGELSDGEEVGKSNNVEAPVVILPEVLKKRISDIRAELGRDVDLPSGLKASLRPYQKEGYQWLSHLAGCGIGACLADDMGLGKTLQIITLLLERGGKGPSLVIAPTSVCPNWISEVRKFAPALRPMLLDSQNETETVVDAAGPYDVAVVSYGMCYFRNDTISKKYWECVVLDEAQAIKNHLAKRTKSVKNIHGAVRIAATGTPVENRLTEFWSIFDFLNPGMLLSVEKFAKRYIDGGMATPALKKIVSPLVLRRLKTEVLDDLPEKTEINISVKLNREEADAYEALRRLALEKMENGGGGNPGRKFEILSELTRLRRFCCHPSLLIPDMKESAKLDALKDILEELKEGGHKALLFSQFTDYLQIVRDMVCENGWKSFYLDGSTPQKQRSDLVSKFQNEEADFFLISLKAGGFGLNLTAANYVILLDPWWNPAVENQAADRIHRIGQKLPVIVYRLIAENTIEERVVALHGEKLKIADDLLGDTGSASLTEGDLMNLLR